MYVCLFESMNAREEKQVWPIFAVLPPPTRRAAKTSAGEFV